MFQVERQEKVLQYINEKQTVRTQELSEMFGVSLVTARADINELAQRGLIYKNHGGAISLQKHIHLETPSSVRNMQNMAAKQTIAAIAVQLIEDEDVIILDSGSTTLEIAKRLNQRNLTVITNDLQIANLLADKKNCSLFVAGGELYPGLHALVGAQTVNYFNNIKVNKLFLGCDAIDLSWGFSSRSHQGVAAKDAMIRSAGKVYCVADHSKFNRQVFVRICNLSDVDYIITDKIEPEENDKLTQLGLQVLAAEKVRTAEK